MELENDFSISYENDLTSNYLVLRTGIGKTLINYQAEMLLNNKLNGLLDFNINYIGDCLNCFYNVTSKCTLASFMTRKYFSRNEFLITILNIINNIYQLKNYLLFDNNILLEENFIFVKPESIDIFFVYLPFLDRKNDIKAFLIKFIFKLVKFHDEYSDNYIQKILEVIKNDNFNLGSLKSLIENLLGEEIKNQTSKNWALGYSNIAKEKEAVLSKNEIDNTLDIKANARLQRNGKLNMKENAGLKWEGVEINEAKTGRFKGNKTEIDRVKTSGLKGDKIEIDRAKTNGFKGDKTEINRAGTIRFQADNVGIEKVKSSWFKTDKAVITKGNIRIPNPPNIKNQEPKSREHKNFNLVMKTKNSVTEYENKSEDTNKRMKLLMYAILLLQPFLLITFILIVNSSFVKMSDNPMNTVIILVLIFLSIDILVIRIINEKRKKEDEMSNYKPLQFITDMMKSKIKPKDEALLGYVNNTYEDQLPIVNERYNGETVIIKKPKPTEIPYLKEKGGEEVVEINKKSFLIGRMESFVDFV
ncbi:MAG: DUF6382 domain-containing protein, partial [Ruminiclostridium sp.]